MNNILTEVLNEFEQIARIPRPSKHEDKIANYLVGRLISIGAEAFCDSVGNVIAEIEPTPGLEDKPVIIMQAHMDMVCVNSNERSDYNPMTDEINLIKDEHYLRAVGTSLGADDGMGIAIILYILQNQQEHGRQRVIFTVDEEVGMSGAAGLDKKYLDGNYLINIDSENADELVIGCAGSLKIELSRNIEWTKPELKSAYKINVTGLKGGHSGEVIHIKHTNAIKVMAQVIEQLNCEVASISGGRAMNVIPSECEAVIITDSDNVNEICDKAATAIKSHYDEPNIKIKAVSTDMPNKVISDKDKDSLLDVAGFLMDGLYDDETSANIGTIQIIEDKIHLQYMPRFHTKHGQSVMGHMAAEAARRSGYDINIHKPSPAWHSESNSLSQLMTDIGLKQGRQLTERIIHGGLECSFFSQKNPELTIISIGTTNIDIHSPKERLLLSSVEPTVNLLMETLSVINNVNDYTTKVVSLGEN
ncbi:MAG: beta-Ala-His dipeptidase [Selenomonadaceae bacterium]|nr:beta-Ala-His dipeptidase [Selenomonadaceae bacterium]